MTTVYIPYTPIPNAFFSLAARLPATTMVILFVIARETLGWHRERAVLSYADLRRSTGIASDATIRRALKQLCAVGVIDVDAPPGKPMTIAMKVSSVFEDHPPSTSTVSVEVEEATSTDSVEHLYSFCRTTSTENVEVQGGFSASESHKPTPLKKEKEILKKEDARTDVRAPHPSEQTISNTTTNKNDHAERLNREISLSESPAPGAARRDRAFEALAASCGIDWRVCTDVQRRQVNQTLAILRRAARAAMPDLTDAARDEELVRRLEHHADWWRRRDWRGRRGERPTPAQLRETWGAAMEEFRAREEARRAEEDERRRMAEIAETRAPARTPEERARAFQEVLARYGIDPATWRSRR